MSSKAANRDLGTAALDGIVVDGITDVLYGLMPKWPNPRVVRDHRRVNSRPKGLLSDRVETVRSGALSQLLRPSGIRQMKAIAGPELQAFFRRLLSIQIRYGETDSAQEHVWQEFAPVLRLFDPTAGSHEPIYQYFRRMTHVVEEALVDAGVCQPRRLRGACLPVAASAFDLAAIAKSIDSDHLLKILNFERTYRAKFNVAKGMVKPPDFYETRFVPIDQIYVPPTFLPRVDDASEGSAWPYELMVRALYRTVILGTPGGGKSTFAQKAFHSISAASEPQLIGSRRATPFLVTVREFGSQRRRGPQGSLFEFIRASISDEHELQIPRFAVEYLVASGRSAVAFDGLDELLDTSFRQEVTAEVESFSTRFADTPVLVTSREVGYDEAPLGSSFDVYKLAPFNEDQVRLYARKWFALSGKARANTERDAEAFFLETSIAPDLRSNPLMLGLMSNIFRGEGYIPRNRPEVFQKCAEMLFDKWDKSRGINAPPSIADDLRFAVNYLAFWIYGDESLQSGVTETDIVSKVVEYLTTWRFDSSETAAHVAGQLVDYCTGRAWVFTDVGTTHDGQRLFQFSHRTFLEYFAASHLVRVHPTPSALVRVLRPRIRRGEWDVVAQLSIQIANKNVQGAGDEILNALLMHSRKEVNGAKWNVLSFVVRALGFMVVHNNTIRAIVEATCRELLSLPLSSDEWVGPFGGDTRSHRAGKVLANLLSVGATRTSVIMRAFESVLEEVLAGGDEAAVRNAVQVLVSGRFARHWAAADSNASGEMAVQLLHKYRRRVMRVAKRDFFAAYELAHTGVLSIRELIEIHGVAALFHPQQFVLYPMLNWPLGSMLLRQFAGVLPTMEAWRSEDDVGELMEWTAKRLLDARRPWLVASNPSFGFSWFEDPVEMSPKAGLPEASPSAFFGAFLIYATFAELRSTYDLERRPAEYRLSRVPMFDLFGEVVAARGDQNLPLAGESLIARFGWDGKQSALLRSWLSGETSFAIRTRSEAIKRTRQVHRHPSPRVRVSKSKSTP